MLNDIGYPGLPILVATLVRTGGVSTVTTIGPNGLIMGDQVIVAGASDPTFNGVFQVLTAPTDPLLFQFAQPGSPDASATGGTATGVGLGNVYTEPVLLPFLNSAYRRVQRALAMAGQTTFKNDQAFFWVPAVASPDPTIQVYLTDAGASITGASGSQPVNNNNLTISMLPVDLIEPLFLWERPISIGPDPLLPTSIPVMEPSQSAFVEMTDVTNSGGLPSLMQTETLRLWEWREDAICFVGALIDTQIRIRYKKGLPGLSDGASQILIRDSQECLADMTAALAANSRGSPLAEKFDSAAEDSMGRLINAATRQQQRVVRRRRPYRARRGLRSGFFF